MDYWLRLYHGTISDDKWPLIARKSGQSVAVVVAVWIALLECASKADDRGDVSDFDTESIDALLQIEDGASEAVFDALCSGKKPRIVNNRIASWDKRQATKKRASDGAKSTDRVREYRARKKAEAELSAQGLAHDVGNECETPCNTNETDISNGYNHETPCNTNETPVKQDETPCNAPRKDKIRKEKIREEKEFLSSPNVDDEETPKPTFASGPSMDFVELRERYNEVGRQGIRDTDGYAEFLALKRSGELVGNALTILDSVNEWADSGQWNGDYVGQFAPKLEKFLTSGQWKRKPKARTPVAKTANGKATTGTTDGNEEALLAIERTRALCEPQRTPEEQAEINRRNIAEMKERFRGKDARAMALAS